MDMQSLFKPNRLTSRTLVILSLFYLFSACNPTTQSTHSPDANWSISLNISGGFAGVMQTLTLDHTGQAVFSDIILKSRVEKQVTMQDLQAYAKLVKNLPDRAGTKLQPSPCRDCFNYALNASYENSQKRRNVDSMTLDNSDAKELISKLITLAKEMKNN